MRASDNPNLVKRARAKYFTLAFLYPLIDLQSPNLKKYWSAWHCSRILNVKHYETHSKVIGKYCKQRFCTVCNRIRTAHYITAYSPVIDSFDDPHFLTLTLRNCTGKQLRGVIRRSILFFREYNKRSAKAGKKNRYLRKLEVTYNQERNDFHPHFHVVIEDAGLADDILSSWFEFWPGVTGTKGQFIRKCDDNAKIELFKYFTDIIKKKDKQYIFEPVAFDIILSALENTRIFQPVGIRMHKDPEQLEIFSQEIAELILETEYYYEDSVGNWIGTHTRNLLTDYAPSQKFKEMCREIGFDDRDMHSQARKKDIFRRENVNLDALKVPSNIKFYESTDK